MGSNARRRSVRRWLPAAAILLLVACQSAVTPGPSATRAPGASLEPGRPSGPIASPGPPTVDLAGSRYTPDAGRNGGTVVIGDVTEANAFQPYFASAPTDRNVAAAAWASLVRLGPDGHYLPDLAVAVPTTANGAVIVPGLNGDAMTVNWQLRPGLQWSDGEPLTCDDVRYAWQWVLNPDNIGVDPSGFEDVEDVECRSATDMVWHFRKVYEGYLTLLLTPLPRHFLSRISMDDQVSGSGFGPDGIVKVPVSGPFRFASDVPGTELRMTANPKYVNPIGGTKAHLAGITWHWFADRKSLIAAFKSGQVDIATGLQASNLPADKALAARAMPLPSLDAETVVLNWSRPAELAAGERPAAVCARNVLVTGRGPGCPTADARLRAGIAAAIDKSAIVREVLGGRAVVTDSAVPADAWFATSDAPVPADPGAARAALDAAGWRAGPDGVRVKDGLRAVIELCALNDPTSTETVSLIAAQLKDIGITVVAHLATADELYADPTDATDPEACSLAGGNFDAALVPVTSPTDPLGFFFAYHGSQVSPDGTNIGAVHDPAIDAALETVATSADPAAIQDAMVAFQTAYRSSAAAVPLYRTTNVDLVGAKIGNVVANPLVQSATWNAADWFRKR
ncbi:MAG: ABC transporter substrate-binding protein [Chloroflexota bacterium]